MGPQEESRAWAPLDHDAAPHPASARPCLVPGAGPALRGLRFDFAITAGARAPHEVGPLETHEDGACLSPFRGLLPEPGPAPHP